MSNIKNKYGQLLAEKHSLSRLCVGREKIETDDVIGEVLTIEDADLAQDVTIGGELKTFSVYTFREYPGKFMYGGLKLTQICPDLLTLAENDNITIADMGIQIMLKAVRTKSNNDFIDVVFI
jgi:hypothetical protein